MYEFASIVTTAMLSGIGVAIGIMVCMTVAALFHRAAMGGKKDQKMANKNWEGSIPRYTYDFFPSLHPPALLFYKIFEHHQGWKLAHDANPLEFLEETDIVSIDCLQDRLER